MLALLIHFHSRIQKDHSLPHSQQNPCCRLTFCSGSRPPSWTSSCRDFLSQFCTMISVIDQGWICHQRKGACDLLQNKLLQPIRYWSNTHVPTQPLYSHWSWIQPSYKPPCLCVLRFGPTCAISSSNMCSPVLALHFSHSAIISPCDLETSLWFGDINPFPCCACECCSYVRYYNEIYEPKPHHWWQATEDSW